DLVLEVRGAVHLGGRAGRQGHLGLGDRVGIVALERRRTLARGDLDDAQLEHHRELVEPSEAARWEWAVLDANTYVAPAEERGSLVETLHHVAGDRGDA